MKTERVTFSTEDSVTIVADWCHGDTPPAYAVLLVHMMPADRSSWQDFAAALAQRGIASLAIDLRGHGESTNTIGGGVLDYRAFSDEEHQASLRDIAAAHSWLGQQEVPVNHVLLVGASIGANLVLQYLSTHGQLPCAVLLSPGLRYHGILVDEAIRSVQAPQCILLAAGSDDTESAEAVRELDRLASIAHDIDWFPGATHGTDLFRAHPLFVERVAQWCADRCKATYS